MPMPRTHFLIGILVTQIVGILGAEVTFRELMFGGVVALLLELDHIILYWIRHRNLRFIHTHHNALEDMEGMQSWIHQWNGWLFFLGITILIAYASKQYALIFLAVMTTHQLLDHEKIRNVYRKYMGQGHFIYPVTTKELCLDALCCFAIVALSLV